MVRYTRKLLRMSNYSYALVLPKELVQRFGWKERQKLDIVELDRKSLKIQDHRV